MKQSQGMHIMRKLFWSFAVLGCLAVPARATTDDVDIVKGALRTVNKSAEQVLAVKNNGEPINTLAIECAFLGGKRFLGMGASLSSNVAAGQTVNMTVYAYPTGEVDNTDCRVTQIKR
jgi:hypothetical protein